MQVTIISGKKYITTQARGVEYTLMRNGDAWGVRTHRLALGRHNFGGFKHFATLADVQTGCRPFASVDLLAVV